MSYEGYEEYLCANGHLRRFDCWDDLAFVEGPFSSESRKCDCGAKFVFHHAVDETNGMVEDDPSTQPYPFKVKVPAKLATCNLGFAHKIEEEIYEIPKKGKR